MLRVLKLYLLLTVATAQNGYQYRKPGRPFSSTTPSPPGHAEPPGPTRTPTAPQTNQGFPGTGQAAPYPGSGYQQAPGYSGPTSPAYSGAPTSSDYSGQGPTGASYPGKTASSPAYPDRDHNAGSAPGIDYFGRGQNYPTPEQPGQQAERSDNPTGQHGSGGNMKPFEGPSYNGLTGTRPIYQGNTGVSDRPSLSRSGAEQPNSSRGQPNSVTEGENENDYSAIPGIPNKDYPILSEIEGSDFSCDTIPFDGYYADTATRCQVFHVCANKMKYSFLCPNGTIFSQIDHVCVWWYQFDCMSAHKYFDVNQSITNLTPPGSIQDGLLSIHSQESGVPGGSQPGPDGSFAGYPDDPGSSKFSGTRGPMSYPGSGSQGSSSHPGTGPQGYPVSQPSLPGSASPSSHGYPSGKPSGPSFPSDRSQFPGSKTPNREYLPPPVNF